VVTFLLTLHECFMSFCRYERDYSGVQVPDGTMQNASRSVSCCVESINLFDPSGNRCCHIFGLVQRMHAKTDELLNAFFDMGTVAY
jgi:hypothetical protein